jgi:RNA polymerase sigma-70 factor, ECF subfamily
MSAPDSGRNLTGLLVAWGNGDESAFEQLAPMIEQDLLRIARSRRRSERTGLSIDTRELVQEVYIRLIEWRKVDWRDRGHFFSVVAKMMRRVLVNHAEKHNSLKRGGDMLQVTFDLEHAPQATATIDLLDIDRTLARLAKFDERMSSVVELRFFGGLTESEIAEALSIPLRTVQREWNLARAWLLKELSAGNGGKK